MIVDHRTGKIAKSEAITEADDLAHAQAQAAAMAKAKTSLKDAVDTAVRKGAGTRAIAATPEVREGRAVAHVTLQKGNELTTFWQPLN